MKYSLLIAIILLATLCNTPSSWAKKDIIISLTPTKTLKGNISFDAVSIMDLRLQKDKLGQVNGAFFKRLNVVTQDSLSISLTRFIHRIIDTTATKQGNKLLILVHALQFKDRVPGNQVISTIYLNADCYLGDGKEYRHILDVDSLYDYVAVRDKDMVKTVSQNLSYLFTMMITNVAILKEVNTPLQSLQQILTKNVHIKSSIPIYNEVPQNGIYYTLKQFLNNTPSDTNFIHDRFCPGSKCYERFYIPTNKERGWKGKNLADTTCFAIYDNGKWYRPYTNNDFEVMTFENGDFYYLAIQKGLYVDDYSSLSRTGYQFGALGALAFSGASSILEDQQYRKPAEFKDALYRLKLNPLTGQGGRIDRLN
jgi:hypothetical protein